MINAAQRLKTQIAAILDIENSTTPLIQEVALAMENCLDKDTARQALPQIQPKLVEIEKLCLSLYRKKRYEAYAGMKPLLQKNRRDLTLKSLRKSLDMAFENIKKLSKGDGLFHNIYLGMLTNPQAGRAAIANLQENLNDIRNTCLLIQNALTISIHTMRMREQEYRVAPIYTKNSLYITRNNPEEIKGMALSVMA